MEETITAVVIAVVGAGVVGVLLLFALRQRRRERAWASLAPALGLEYVGDERIAERYPSFELFELGHSHLATGLLRWERGGARVALGDYQYVVSSHSRELPPRCLRFTLLLLERADLELPRLLARPQRKLDLLGRLLGAQDLDFRDDPTFSRAFVLQGTSESAVRRRFDAESRAWFCAHAGTLLRFQARGPLVAILARRLEPARAARLLDDALELLARWREADGEPAGAVAMPSTRRSS